MDERKDDAFTINYPDHLNPFGDDEEDDTEDSNVGSTNGIAQTSTPVVTDEAPSKTTTEFKSKDEYPDHLNPFGDDSENEDVTNDVDQVKSVTTTQNTTHTQLNSSVQKSYSCVIDDYPDHLNPFGDDEGDVVATNPPVPLPRTKKLKNNLRDRNGFVPSAHK